MYFITLRAGLGEMSNFNCQDPAGAGPFGPGTWMHVKLISSLNVSVKGYFFCVFCQPCAKLATWLGHTLPLLKCRLGLAPAWFNVNLYNIASSWSAYFSLTLTGKTGIPFMCNRSLAEVMHPSLNYKVNLCILMHFETQNHWRNNGIWTILTA